MDNERFDLVFTGELVPGANATEVKQNLSRLFKMELARVELLFSGKPVVLKRGLDLDAASRYRVAMKKAGARISTVPNRQAAASADAATRANTARMSEGVAKIGAAAPEAVAHETSSPGLGLAPMEGDLVRPEERAHPPHVHVEIAHLSLRPATGDLVEESEREILVPLPVALQDWEVAPVGAEVLKAEERSQQPEGNVDTSGLSLAEPGAQLGAPKPPPPVAPDTSRLRLADADLPVPKRS